MFVVVSTETEDQQRRRRGYWLRLARRRTGLTLKEVALEMGYSLRSQSTIKLWEDGLRDPSDIQITRLAAVYKVPSEVFFKPAPTDEERLEERIRHAIAEASSDDAGQRAS